MSSGSHRLSPVTCLSGDNMCPTHQCHCTRQVQGDSGTSEEDKKEDRCVGWKRTGVLGEAADNYETVVMVMAVWQW